MAMPHTMPAARMSQDAAVEDMEHSLRQLAEICAEAHAIVARDGPDAVRAPLEDLLRRVAEQLAHRFPTGGAE